MVTNGSQYVIDLDGKVETSFPLSSIFGRVRPIILETRAECLIGSINEIQVFDGYIFVLDLFVSKSLFVFDMEGRFIRKIGALGNGPGEYIEIRDFTLDTENGFIFLCDRGTRIHKYKLDGTYISSITLQIPESNVLFIQSYNNKLYASTLGFNPTPKDYMLLEVSPDDGKVLSSFLPLKYNKGWAELFSTGHSFFMSRVNNPPRYTQLFMDYIISVGGDTITPYIELKSKNLVTKENIENLPENINVFDKVGILEKSSKIWDVQNFVENDSLITFRCRSSAVDYLTVIYYKETREIQLAKYFNNDLIYKQDSKNNWFGLFIFHDARGSYSMIHPRLLKGFQESIINGEVISDLYKIEELKQLNEESNPVILFYEYK